MGQLKEDYLIPLETYKDDEKKVQSSGQEEKFTNLIQTSLKVWKPGNYDKLNPNGLRDINKQVNSNDIIIGKVMPVKEK